MMLKEQMELRFPDHDWSHLVEDSCFIVSKGVYSIKQSCWYDDLPQWTSDEIAAFLSE